MRTMITLQEALDTVLQAASPLETVELPLLEAVGLAAAAEVRSPIPSPPFANSAMDGYALRSQDLAAGLDTFTVVAEVPAGGVFGGDLAPGQAIRILTGAAVPASTDTVVPQEDVEYLPEGRIRVREAPPPGRHIRRVGEDFPAGTILLQPGQTVDPPVVGLLASIGRAVIAVRRRPRVAVLSTGEELLDIHEELVPGKIRNSNSYSLAAAVQLAGAVPVPAGRVADQVEALVTALQGIPPDCDVILTSGGVSVGDYDLVAPSLQKLGFRPLFHRVAIKPGKPLLFGLLGHRLVFGLSGNPTASLVLFEMLVRPALRRMMGFRDLFRPRVRATLTRGLKKHDRRLHLVRAHAFWVDGRWQVTPRPGQGSADVLTLSRANALAVHPAEVAELQAGEAVEVYLIRQTEAHWAEGEVNPE